MPDELTTADVLALIEDKTGKAISAKTWSSYVTRGQAPKPARHLSRTPLFSREDIEQWIANRPGSGARTDLRG
ncbi:helix-turn-helix transcriptional regulator [Rhodococcoides kyotonense]|uniref:Transcriptional regulator n=1 Tax=Rhodococcoides kyotonense TaxID=398843 RepID=A0A177YER4_9NOCA|nr:transcriptional regulator [Rhodococcus kyotonensis]OAK54003.1 transcriptional regulator [Rhodococcus kyotonensis]